MLLGVAILSASLLTRSPLASATDAAIGGCRSDHVVTLSNGGMLDLHATVHDTTTDVQQISYTRHARASVGTWVTSVVNTPALGPKDSFQFCSDEPLNTYRAGAEVSTVTPQALAATTDLVGVTGTVLATTGPPARAHRCSG
jgi:hypothetical protein